MPKYCSVPNCKNDGDDRKSFYRFPLQDPVRLQRWLRNMGRETWTPSRHQYICHEHFTSSCFRVRWGIRYLEPDAVPTVFQELKKRKALDQSEMTPKRLQADSDKSIAVSHDRTETTPPHTLHLYEVAMETDGSLVESSDDGSLHTDPNPPSDGFRPGPHIPFTFFQTVYDLSGGGGDVVVMSDCPAAEDELLSGIAAAVLRPAHVSLGAAGEAITSLAIEDATCTAEEFSDVHETHEVIAYFETMPSVFPAERCSQVGFSPDTLLSSALSSKPITSTLPIVSKHLPPPPPSSLVLTVERLETEEGEGDGGQSEEDSREPLDHQLEEHCYHKNSLSKEQLEAIVSELQKKVKVLQQRHRRHLEKLAGLENTVSQLRQSNLLNEERLQLLERAYIQTGAAVTDAGQTVTIIYEEDAAAHLNATR